MLSIILRGTVLSPPITVYFFTVSRLALPVFALYIHLLWYWLHIYCLLYTLVEGPILLGCNDLPCALWEFLTWVGNVWLKLSLFLLLLITTSLGWISSCHLHSVCAHWKRSSWDLYLQLSLLLYVLWLLIFILYHLKNLSPGKAYFAISRTAFSLKFFCSSLILLYHPFRTALIIFFVFLYLPEVLSCAQL